MTEHWTRAYREAPEIFDAFALAEDPDGLIVRSLLRHAELDGRTVLEIGCGTGRYTGAFVVPSARYVALERSLPMLAIARRRVPAVEGRPRFLCARAQALPVRSGSVDRVIAGWVVGNLAPTVRTRALGEIDRVLRPARGAAAWLIENHWSGEFHELRGGPSVAERTRVRSLIDDEGFRPVGLVETDLRFPSPGEACRVLGYLCGSAVRRRLEAAPRARIGHHVVILRRPGRARARR